MNTCPEKTAPGTHGEARVGAILLVLALLLVAALDLLARNKSLATAIDNEDREFSRKAKVVWFDPGYFADFEDRMILDEMPSADYSKGSVVFLGSSNMKWAVKLWDLPLPERRLLHNYGLGAANHTDEFQLVRHLVDHDGLLRAGGRNTLIILGVSYHTVAHVDGPNSFVSKLWGRHALFEYSPESGVREQASNVLFRFWTIERERCAGFVGRLADALHKYTIRVRGRDRFMSPRKHDPEQYNQMWKVWMGSEWKEKIAHQTSELARLLDYLKALDVPVVVVCLPQATWEERLPFKEVYRAAVFKICQARSIPIRDWSRKIEDQDFGDSVHLNLDGLEKLQKLWLDLAFSFLHRTGALP